MTSTSTNLFPRSRHQAFHDAQFRTAGNDIYESPTYYNIHVHTPGLPGSDPTHSQTTSVPAQGWSLSRVIQILSGLLQSPEHRGALVHGGNPSEGETAHPVEVRLSVSSSTSNQGAIVEGPAPVEVATDLGSGLEDRASQSEDMPGQSQDSDCLVVRTVQAPVLRSPAYILTDSITRTGLEVDGRDER
jgi:hypothetical protein